MRKYAPLLGFLILVLFWACKDTFHPEGPSTPGTPGGVTILETVDEVLVRWGSVDRAQYYSVHYDKTKTKRSNGIQNNLKFTEAELKRGETYTFTVTAHNASGSGPHSEPRTGKLSLVDTSISKPGKPVIVKAEGLSSSEIKVEWDPVKGADFYLVYYAKTLEDLQDDKSDLAPKATGTSLTVNSLEPDTEYWFTVVAHNGRGGGDKANPEKSRSKASPGPSPSPATLAQALALISDEAEKHGGGEFIIPVTEDESLAPQILDYRFPVKITLKVNGSRQTISLSGNGSLFTVKSGVTLILDNNITLQGHSDNTDSLVKVEDGGTFIMNSGSAISGNIVLGGSGIGGGVHVRGTFTMNNGSTISNNSVRRGGGVYIRAGSFVMNGGTINGNTAAAGDNGGGGVYVGVGSIFTMNSGFIRDNITDGDGGGVIVEGTFTMNGGVISGNKANVGGGIYNYATFSKTGSSVIYGDLNNTYSPGSGENTATSGQGHAVYWNRYPNDNRYRNSTLEAGVNISTNDAVNNWDSLDTNN
jgi:hypothetical protein